MAIGSEKYQADRENNQGEASDSSKKVAKIAAKGAADYFTGGKGGAIVDKVADSKLGQAAINTVAKEIDRNPLLKKAAEKLDESGVADVADQALSVMETAGTQGAGSSAGGKSLGGDSILDSLGKSNKSTSDTTPESSVDGSGELDSVLDIDKASNSFNIMDMMNGKIGMKITIIFVGFIFFIIFSFIIFIAGSDENGTEPNQLHGDDGTSTGGACTYNIKGFRIGSNIVKKEMEISNLKVRLMECGSPYGNGSYDTPLNEPLIDFETYIAGVANAEIGTSVPAEAIKAQMVAARSYSLARPTAMNNALGKKLEKENGQWILQISSCVADQVFCNIDQGCSYMGGGDGQGGIVRSGNVSGALRTRPALATDHILRTLAQEVKGEVLVDKSGYIISAGYLSTEQNMFTSLANSGLNYKQILLQVYNQGSRNYGAYDIQQMSCSSSSVSTGAFANWKQYGSSWSSINLGTSSKTIGSSGCLVTSVAMLIAKSGVSLTISGDFNPGTFVQALNANNGFSGANFMWSTTSIIAPNFIYQTQIAVGNLSREEKLSKINNLLNNGYYVVAEVKGNTGQHWVAIDSVSGTTINMMDPGSTATSMWDQYNWANTSTLAYFKVS